MNEKAVFYLNVDYVELEWFEDGWLILKTFGLKWRKFDEQSIIVVLNYGKLTLFKMTIKSNLHINK